MQVFRPSWMRQFASDEGSPGRCFGVRADSLLRRDDVRGRSPARAAGAGLEPLRARQPGRHPALKSWAVPFTLCVAGCRARHCPAGLPLAAARHSPRVSPDQTGSVSWGNAARDQVQANRASVPGVWIDGRAAPATCSRSCSPRRSRGRRRWCEIRAQAPARVAVCAQRSRHRRRPPGRSSVPSSSIQGTSEANRPTRSPLQHGGSARGRGLRNSQPLRRRIGRRTCTRGSPRWNEECPDEQGAHRDRPLRYRRAADGPGARPRCRALGRVLPSHRNPGCRRPRPSEGNAPDSGTAKGRKGVAPDHSGRSRCHGD